MKFQQRLDGVREEADHFDHDIEIEKSKCTAHLKLTLYEMPCFIQQNVM